MKNRLSDLNNHLFAQLERLTEDDLTPEKIEQEAQRTEAIVKVADQIIRNADLTFKAASFVANHGDRYRPALSGLIGSAVTAEGSEK